MLIETNPCDMCDCSPAFCDGDIEICQLTRGNAKPISSEQYEAEKLEECITDSYRTAKNELENDYFQRRREAGVPVVRTKYGVFIKGEI